MPIDGKRTNQAVRSLTRRWVIRATAAAGIAAPFIRRANAAAVKIRLSYVVPGNWASLLFQKPGLARHLDKSYTFEAVRFQGTPQLIQAQATGELEIAAHAYSSIALAIENAGMDDLRIIADEFQDGAPGYYSNEYFVLKDGPIQSIEDLKGKVIATNVAGSAVDIAMRAMLRKHKLEDKRDLTIIEAPFPTMPAMLQDKKIVMFPGVLPFSQDPQIRQMTRRLFSQRDAIGRTQMVVWAAREPFIKTHRDALLDFLEDALGAERWYLDPANHEESVAIAARISKSPPSHWDSWFFKKNGEAGDYYHDPNGLPDLAALQTNINLQHELNFIKATFDVHKYADLSLMGEAAKRLGGR
jgi:sulfonate transport system substrate-binding protein